MTCLSATNIIRQEVLASALKERKVDRAAVIDKTKTGQQIRLLMAKRGVTVKDIKTAISLVVF